MVVLSENLWRGVFHADPEILGKGINLDKKSFTVIGVLPSRFRFPNVAEADQLWIPLPQDPLFGGWMGGAAGTGWLRRRG